MTRTFQSNGIKPNPPLTCKIGKSGDVGWSFLKHPLRLRRPC